MMLHFATSLQGDAEAHMNTSYVAYVGDEKDGDTTIDNKDTEEKSRDQKTVLSLHSNQSDYNAGL